MPCPCTREKKLLTPEKPEDVSSEPSGKPVDITFEDIVAAKERIDGLVIKTPLFKSHISEIAGMDIYLKLELFQYTGSFKERGAVNTLLMMPPQIKETGVISASSGNHAQALSYQGNKMGFKVYVVMPVNTPLMKIEKCKKYKSNIILDGDEFTTSEKIGMKTAQEQGMKYVNGYDDPEIIAGQGTIGIELIEQNGDIDAVVIPYGGGGLCGGIAIAVKHLKPDIKVIAVEADSCPGLKTSLENDQIVEPKTKPTLAESINVRRIGVNSFEIAKKLVDKSVVVNEEQIAHAMLRYAEQEKLVVEGGAAVGLAALLSGQLDEFKGKKVAMIVSGGNVDTIVLRKAIDKGMASEGRLIRIKILLKDRKGGVTDFCRNVENLGIHIKNILHERAWVTQDVYSVSVKLICELRDHNHLLEVKGKLTQSYPDILFLDFPENKML